MATEVEFEFEDVKVSLRGDVVTGQVISTGGGLFPVTHDFTHILWPGGGKWEDVSNDVLESADLEVWKENARQHIRDRRVQSEELKAMQAAQRDAAR